MDGDEIIQHLRQTRYVTLALADQIKDDRWSDPLLPDNRTIQDLLAHLIAWDEWFIAVLDISRVRDLPSGVMNALRDVDAYNARAMARFQKLTRDDILGSLQGASDRLLKSVYATGPDWESRVLPPLTMRDGTARQIKVSRLLRSLTKHEASHHQEIEQVYEVHAPVPDASESGD